MLYKKILLVAHETQKIVVLKHGFYRSIFSKETFPNNFTKIIMPLISFLKKQEKKTNKNIDFMLSTCKIKKDKF